MKGEEGGGYTSFLSGSFASEDGLRLLLLLPMAFEAAVNILLALVMLSVSLLLFEQVRKKLQLWLHLIPLPLLLEVKLFYGCNCCRY